MDMYSDSELTSVLHKIQREALLKMNNILIKKQLKSGWIN